MYIYIYNLLTSFEYVCFIVTYLRVCIYLILYSDLIECAYLVNIKNSVLSFDSECMFRFFLDERKKFTIINMSEIDLLKHWKTVSNPVVATS